ncbi:hypothetical protein GTO10_02320 [Candidatus Saccharibacteria bacterium]|nr:hypothetical protein [Candidatus Saccharibacteria bacterium]
MIGYYYYTTKVRPYLLEPERSSYTFGVLTLATVLFFGLLVIRPLASSTISAYGQLKSGSSYSATLTQKIIAIDQATVNFASVSSQLDRLESEIPKGTSQSTLITELSKDAGQSGATLTAVTFDTDPRDGGDFLDFNMSSSVPTKNLVVLLEELERDRLLNIQNIRTNLREDQGQSLWDATIQGRAPYIP